MALTLSAEAKAEAADFEAWRNAFYEKAIKQGISQATLDSTLGSMEPMEKVIKLDKKQPEVTITLENYIQKVVSKQRIKEGRKLLRKHRDLLEKVSKQYGVQPRFIVALWGIETSYGKITGGTYVPHALATLAYEGRRAEFFEKELLTILNLVEKQEVSADKLIGSWAGAMGQCQFMPSSFVNFAQDGDGDGKRDIWHSLPDVFASIANYLSKHGWEQDYTWGRPVSITQSFDRTLAGTGNDKTRTVGEWRKLGVKQLPPVKFDGLKANVVLPEHGQQNYLVYKNYKTLLLWNRSIYFATAVGKLADAIARP